MAELVESNRSEAIATLNEARASLSLDEDGLAVLASLDKVLGM
jgi:hypothetical protein